MEMQLEVQEDTSLLPIRVEGDNLAVSSVDFAKGLGIQHRNLIDTIRTHQETIESRFGIIAFETEKSQTSALARAGRNTTIAYLSEDQALLVGTLSRNSKRVVEFKATLVLSFSVVRKRLLIREAQNLAVLPQVMLDLVSQQAKMLASHQEQFGLLQAEMAHIKANAGRPGKQPGMPGFLPLTLPANLRQTIDNRIDEYCSFYRATQEETLSYLYKCFYNQYGVNVFRVPRLGSQSWLDALEQQGHLLRFYELIVREFGE